MFKNKEGDAKVCLMGSAAHSDACDPDNICDPDDACEPNDGLCDPDTDCEPDDEG